MILYAAIMFVHTAIFGTIAALIYKGKTNLIHNYHQTKVADKAAYGKAFGKAMGIIAGAMALSGLIGLRGESAAVYAVVVLLLGLGIGTVFLFRVQEKYNGGVM